MYVSPIWTWGPLGHLWVFSILYHHVVSVFLYEGHIHHFPLLS